MDINHFDTTTVRDFPINRGVYVKELGYGWVVGYVRPASHRFLLLKICFETGETWEINREVTHVHKIC